ncbi:hypothetical protein [Amycolatopsis albispora]|uniref:Uncharacterized protein n=1 Tax=Amycolatopsis albispora TaxID=1804986 RepID=A0A344LCZ6_9PSEU|nr:hypothetical protein [Amycolatopsis albispora]AXB45920.1 hypothetical protein A4R43_28410 [Amycolatopsis albispora]
MGDDEAGPTTQLSKGQVLAGVIGFVLGGSVLGALWALSGSETGPASDARAACAALARIEGLSDTSGPVSGRSLPPGTLDRLAAAKSLAEAAAELQPAYEQLADHVDGVHRMVVSLNFDAGGRWHLDQATEICSRT